MAEFDAVCSDDGTNAAATPTSNELMRYPVVGQNLFPVLKNSASTMTHMVHEYGAGVAYWEDRHAEDFTNNQTFDWLFEYAHLRRLLRTHVARDGSVLQFGCGNSRLAHEWCLDGHRGPFRNVDFAPALVARLQADWLSTMAQEDALLLCRESSVSFEVADVRALDEHDFPSGSFDCVLDKSTFDCIACNGASYQEDLEAMLLCACRVLKPGGIYLLVSCGEPESRLAWLDDEPGLDWDVSVAFITTRSRSETDGGGVSDDDDDDNDDSGSGKGGSQDATSVGDSSVYKTPRGSKKKEVLVSEEVLVSGNDSWQDELEGVGENDHTFVYICRKYPRQAQPDGL